jgi:1-acyl-sn-glycerol-3-phosphate acyltransferase
MVWTAASFVFLYSFRSGVPELEARARWLQVGCRRALRVFNLQIQSYGPIPTHGLLVSNHLSYLDVLILSALTPSIFVAKQDVKHWPVFGWFARLGGTLFADRSRRAQVMPLTRELRNVLDQGALVALFPEGTSSGGRTVLPFKSALLESVANSFHPLAACRIDYSLEDGDTAEEVCYWKDMTFLPHLLNLLSKERVDASVRFSEVHASSSDRKHLALQLRCEVSKLTFVDSGFFAGV